MGDAAQRLEVKPNAGPQTTAAASPADIVIYGGGAGAGKMLALDTPVPTPSGWTTMGDLEAGDAVFDEAGRPCTVVRAHPIDMSPIAYRMRFDDGSEVTACADHLWLTLDARDLAALTRRDPEHRARRREKRGSRATGNRSEAFTAAVTARNKRLRPPTKPPPAGSVRSTADIAATLTVRGGRRNHAIPVADPLQTSEAQVPVDPYVLGLWLGDGHSHEGTITTADHEVVEALRRAGYEVRKWPSQRYAYGVGGLTGQLRPLGVLRNKHVPATYLRGSMEQRLALLQGLMDTDGYCGESGGAEFTSTNRELAEAVQELAVSLGSKAAIREGRATLDGRDCGPKYRVPFSSELPLFRIERKLCRQKRDRRRTTLFRYVVSCERVESVPMRCITVDSPSSLYLCGKEMVPTHNSWWLVYEAARGAHVPGYRGVLFRRTSPELTGGGGIWDEAQKLYRLMGGRPRAGASLDFTWHHGDAGESRVEFRHLQREHDVHAHHSRAYAFVGFDEVQQFSEMQFLYMLSRLRVPDDDQSPLSRMRPYVRASCNPDPESFVRRWIDWWIGEDGYPIEERSGVVRWFARDSEDAMRWGDSPDEVRAQVPGKQTMSLTFVPGRLEDNPYLRDTSYRGQLQQLDYVNRARLLEGNWDVRPASGTLFQRSWFTVVDELPAKPVRTIRFWDKAGTRPSNDNPDPDWTRGAKVSRLADGSYAIEHIEGLRDTPGSVRQAMARLAQQDGFRCMVGVWQDPGQAGVADVEATAGDLKGHRFRRIRASQNKVAYAEVWSAIAEHGTVYVVRGPWNEAFFREIEAFPEGRHDDAVDAVSGAFQVLTKKGAHDIIEAFAGG